MSPKSSMLITMFLFAIVATINNNLDNETDDVNVKPYDPTESMTSEQISEYKLNKRARDYTYAEEASYRTGDPVVGAYGMNTSYCSAFNLESIQPKVPLLKSILSAQNSFFLERNMQLDRTGIESREVRDPVLETTYTVCVGFSRYTDDSMPDLSEPYDNEGYGEFCEEVPISRPSYLTSQMADALNPKASADFVKNIAAHRGDFERVRFCMNFSVG